jgi:hypothetical protein
MSEDSPDAHSGRGRHLVERQPFPSLPGEDPFRFRPEPGSARDRNTVADRELVETLPRHAVREEEAMVGGADYLQAPPRRQANRGAVAHHVPVVDSSAPSPVRDDSASARDQLRHRHHALIGEHRRRRSHAGPPFVHDLRHPLRGEVVGLVADHAEHVALPVLEGRVLEQEEEDVPLWLLGDLLLPLRPLLEARLLLLEERRRVDVAVHVALAGEPAHRWGILLDVAGGLPLVAPLDEVGVGVDEVLEAQAGVDEVLDRLDAVAVDVVADPRRVVRHLVDHPAVGLAEPEVVLEEVGVAEHVRHHQLLLHLRVRLHEVGVDGVVVDHELVDLGEAVGVALAELLVVHPEPPVRVAGREASEGRDLVELVVVEQLEHHVVEVEAVLAGVALDLAAPAVEVGREVGHLPQRPSPVTTSGVGSGARVPPRALRLIARDGVRRGRYRHSSYSRALGGTARASTVPRSWPALPVTKGLFPKTS